MMRVTLHILVLCVLSYVEADINIFIQEPVRILDCRGRSPLVDGATQTTTYSTQKPADPREIWYAARHGDLQYIENEISRLGASSLNLDWQNPDSYEDGTAALHVAALYDRPSIVSALLQAGADPNVQDDLAQTPVYIAAKYNKIDVLRILLDPKYQADVNLADEEGRTPVYSAALYDHSAILELLLVQGHGNPNKVTDDGASPLMTASAWGQTACVRVLLAAGAHVNYVNPRDGWTALHQAARNDELDVALVLLEAGATKDTEDNKGRTPADAARTKSYESVAELIENF